MCASWRADPAQLSQILALVYYGSVSSTTFSKGSGRCTDPTTEGANVPSMTESGYVDQAPVVVAGISAQSGER